VVQLNNKNMNTIDEQKIMSELFATYYEQCPSSKINYALYDPTKSQGHIVLLDIWMEIIHFTNSIKFTIIRGEQEYFFDTYAKAIEYSELPIEKFNELMDII
jgi:hypothetical protein